MGSQSTCCSAAATRLRRRYAYADLPISPMPSAAYHHAQHHHYRYKVRATQAPPMQMTNRDLSILEAVHKYRVLHRGQISHQFFAGLKGEGQGSTARRRLGLLYQNGYLERIPRFVAPPMNNPGPAYRLAARGAAILAHQAGAAYKEFNYWGRAEDDTSHVTRLGHSYLEHALWLADLRKQFEQKAEAIGAASCAIEKWLDYLELRKAWKTERVWVQLSPGTPRENLAIAPDGYFVLSTPKGRGHCFLEADRGTETIDKQWKRKLLAYTEYLASGKFHQRYRVAAGTGFRVLTITTTPVRARNLQQAAERYVPQNAKAFLFTSTDLFQANPLSTSIWQRGGSSAAEAVL